MDRGAWRATVCGVAKSQTRLSDSHPHTHIRNVISRNSCLCCVRFSGSARGKEPARECRRCKRDMGLIPGSARSPGGGHGNPLQSPYLENPMDRGNRRAIVCGVTKSQTGLKPLTRVHVSPTLQISRLSLAPLVPSPFKSMRIYWVSNMCCGPSGIQR